MLLTSRPKIQHFSFAACFYEKKIYILLIITNISIPIFSLSSSGKLIVPTHPPYDPMEEEVDNSLLVSWVIGFIQHITIYIYV